MFSFFRKKDQDGNETQSGPTTVASRLGDPSTVTGRLGGPTTQSAAANPATVAPLANTPTPAALNDSQNYDLSKLTIEVGSGSESLTPAEEQAAMLHANGQLAAAVSILESEKPAFVGKQKLESWLMLFELYQQQHDHKSFDALALEYVVEFERTPPIWRQHVNMPKKTAAASGFYAFAAKLTFDTIEKEIAQFSAIRDKNPSMRVDFSKVQKIDTLGAAELVSALNRRNKQLGQMQVLGSQSLIKLISQEIEVGRRAPAEAPFWLLLIEIHQVLGLQEEFENLAVDYAITFEVSPPSWDTGHVPKTSAQIASDEASAQAELKKSADEEAQLIGNITADHPQLLAKMGALIGTSSQVTLDFSRIDRIDFESAGQLLNLAMGWMQQGKQIRISNTNELVLGLLRVMGIAEMLQVERRK